jgi:hypothetical protein
MDDKAFPQRLKPHCLQSTYGTTEVVTLHQSELFRSLLVWCP